MLLPLLHCRKQNFFSKLRREPKKEHPNNHSLHKKLFHTLKKKKSRAKKETKTQFINSTRKWEDIKVSNQRIKYEDHFPPSQKRKKKMLERKQEIKTTQLTFHQSSLQKLLLWRIAERGELKDPCLSFPKNPVIWIHSWHKSHDSHHLFLASCITR